DNYRASTVSYTLSLHDALPIFAVVPEFGSSYSVPARSGYLRAAELILLGLPFNATRAADLGLVTRVMADEKLLETATQTARDLRSEEHTSELQSRFDLVCRLLL